MEEYPTTVSAEDDGPSRISKSKETTALAMRAQRRDNNIENDIQNCKACTIIIVHAFQLFKTKNN